jgi:hypothetical protein
MCRFGLPRRPLSAVVQVCSQRLESSAAAAMESGRVDSVVHELLHALYFYDAYFSSYLPPLPGPQLSGRLTAVTSAAVVREARAQFACASLSDVPLEDDGPAGSPGTHWEALALQGDIMASSFSGRSSRRRVVSRVTLALAEDSGWFVPEWLAAGFLRRGFRSGCGLIEEVWPQWCSTVTFRQAATFQSLALPGGGDVEQYMFVQVHMRDTCMPGCLRLAVLSRSVQLELPSMAPVCRCAVCKGQHGS